MRDSIYKIENDQKIRNELKLDTFFEFERWFYAFQWIALVFLSFGNVMGFFCVAEENYGGAGNRESDYVYPKFKGHVWVFFRNKKNAKKQETYPPWNN